MMPKTKDAMRGKWESALSAYGLSDKQLQYEMIKANKEIALSPNTKIIIMPADKNVPIILNN